MPIDDLQALVARHLPPGQSLDEEMVRLAKISAKQRADLAERLAVVDAYLTGQRQGNAEADEAAAKLGRSRRQFLRLVAKMREFGPIRGLAPGYRNNPRRAQPRDGLFAEFDEVDEIVRDWVRIGTHDAVSTLATKVRAQCAAFDLAPPSDATLRKRIHALRAEGLERKESGSLGSDLLIEQVPLNLPVGDNDASALATVTLIVDTYTTIILGVGVMVDPLGVEGLSWALGDLMGRRWQSLTKYNGLVAERVDRVTWMLPLEVSEPEVLTSAATASAIELRMLPSGTRRVGAALMRLLGDRLGPYAFAPRAGQAKAIRLDRPGVSLDVAARALSASADAWNRGRLEMDTPKARLTMRIARFRADKIKALGQQLVHLFEPVLTPVALQAVAIGDSEGKRQESLTAERARVRRS
jgi:hypothetical protein